MCGNLVPFQSRKICDIKKSLWVYQFYQVLCQKNLLKFVLYIALLLTLTSLEKTISFKMHMARLRS